MATLTTTRSYITGSILYKADIDAFLNSIEYFLNTTGVSDSNIQGAGISGNLKLGEASITASKIADTNVTTAKILDANVTTAKIADSAVTTAKILDANVTTAKILDANVTTAKIATNAITAIKKAAVNVASSGSSSSAQTVTEGATASISIISTAITTSGRPVILSIHSNAGLSFSYPGGSVRSGYINFIWKRNGSNIGISSLGYNILQNSYVARISLNYLSLIDFPSSGLNTYTVDVQCIGFGYGTAVMFSTVNGIILTAVEL